MNIPTDEITESPGPNPDYPVDVSAILAMEPLVIEPALHRPNQNIARLAFTDLFLSIALWLFSILAVTIIPASGALLYVLIRYKGTANIAQVLIADPTVLLLSVIGVIPAHVLTFAAAWAIVTRLGARPFWRTLGWSFGQTFGLWWCVGLAIMLYLVGAVLAKLIGGGPTDIDVLVNSSLAVRIILAVVATASGPLVEEVVYRGIIYSAVEKLKGMAWAVAIVSFLFAFVHLYQYRNNGGVIVVIVLLSISLTLVRAFTGRLLPCFIIHMVFNGIVSILIVFQPYIAQFDKSAQPKNSLVILWRLLCQVT